MPGERDQPGASASTSGRPFAAAAAAAAADDDGSDTEEDDALSAPLTEEKGAAAGHKYRCALCVLESETEREIGHRRLPSPVRVRRCQPSSHSLNPVLCADLLRGQPGRIQGPRLGLRPPRPEQQQHQQPQKQWGAAAAAGMPPPPPPAHTPPGQRPRRPRRGLLWTSSDGTGRCLRRAVYPVVTGRAVLRPPGCRHRVTKAAVASLSGASAERGSLSAHRWRRSC